MTVYWAKPTLDDIAAQEEKRRADWKQAERERLRDKFAAAALTGLLSNIPRYQLGVIAVQAYGIADEMLRERGQSDRSQPIGSPAKTNPTQPRNGTPVEGSVRGEGSVPDSRSENEPVAWWVMGAECEYEYVTLLKENANASVEAEGGTVIPLYRHPQDWAFLNDEIARLRDAIRRLAEQDATLSVQGGSVTVTLDATLTDNERAAIMASQGFWALEDSPHAATLRNLLERLT